MRATTSLYNMPKDMLIKLITTLQEELKADQWIAEPDLYDKVKNLFKDIKNGEIEPNPIPQAKVISAMIGETIKQLSLHPIDLSIRGREEEPVDPGENLDTEEEYEWAEQHSQWNSILVEGVRKIIAINISGSNTDKRSGGPDIPNEEFTLVKQFPNREVTLSDLTEVVFRLKSSKNDFWYELYQGIDTYLDKRGILYIQARFDHGS